MSILLVGLYNNFLSVILAQHGVLNNGLKEKRQL